MKPPNLRKLQQQCDRFNAAYPVGSAVRFRPVAGYRTTELTRTRSAAYVLSGHTAVIFVEGRAGCVALDHCEPEPGPLA